MSERLRPRVTKTMRVAAIGALTLIAEIAILQTIAPDKANCPTIENEALNHVYGIMEERYPEESDGIFDTAETNKEIKEGYWPYAKDQAEKYDLTLVDSRPHIREISEASSIDQVFANLNDFTSQYGFSVDIPTEEGVVGESTYYPLSRESIQLEDLKKRAKRFLRFFSFIPLELVRLSGIEHMVLVGSFADRTSGKADSSTRSISIRFDYFDMDTITHEMSHLIDGVICGADAGKDSQFRELNPKGFQYGEGDESQLYKTVVDMYGQTNPLEDKATMMANILDGLWTLDYSSPVIESKIAHLLTELEMKVPHIAAYLRSLELIQVTPLGYTRSMLVW